MVLDWECRHHKHQNVPSMRAGVRTKMHKKETTQLVMCRKNGPVLKNIIFNFRNLKIKSTTRARKEGKPEEAVETLRLWAINCCIVCQWVSPSPSPFDPPQQHLHVQNTKYSVHCKTCLQVLRRQKTQSAASRPPSPLRPDYLLASRPPSLWLTKHSKDNPSFKDLCFAKETIKPSFLFFVGFLDL